jgi:hypothetical protein
VQPDAAVDGQAETTTAGQGATQVAQPDRATDAGRPDTDHQERQDDPRSRAALEGMTRAQLQSLARKRGVSDGGNKAALVDRLVDES